MEESKKAAVLPHGIVLNNREQGTVSGVLDVQSFDEKVILLASQAGLIHIRGENLHVSRLDLEKGEVDIHGKVDSIQYTEKGKYGRKKEETLLGRLFQ